jgi:phosphatidylglycerophosphate synthase
MHRNKAQEQEKKTHDIFDKLLRTFTTPIAERLNIPPNLVTVIAFLLAVSGAMMIFYNTTLAALLILLGLAADFLDGDIARIHHRMSEKGAWLDVVLDKYSDFAVTLMVMLTLLATGYDHTVIILGSLAIFSLLAINHNNYAFEKFFYRNNLVYKIPPKPTIIYGYSRTKHILLASLLIFFNQLYLYLILFGTFMFVYVIALSYIHWRKFCKRHQCIHKKINKKGCDKI